MTDNLSLFQTDLRNGMSITDALQKHDLTFKQAFNTLNRKKIGRPAKAEKQPRQSSTGEKYISQLLGRYYLRKKIKNKTVVFGTYKTLEDAVKVRDYCIKHGWYINCLDSYCKRVGVKRLKRGK